MIKSDPAFPSQTAQPRISAISPSAMLWLRWAMVSSSSADTLSSMYRAHRAVDVDGLGEVGVHARGEAFLNVLMVGVGCEGDDGDAVSYTHLTLPTTPYV